jgi:tryptophan 2,3-dioxygenase
MEFRDALASASGIQSSQYRAVEFILGIGHKTRTGGSSAVEFLRRALDLTFFP